MIVADTDVLVDALRGRSPAAERIELEAAGTPIAMADYMIAGTCLVHSAILLTHNRKHFERVPGLALGWSSARE